MTSHLGRNYELVAKLSEGAFGVVVQARVLGEEEDLAAPLAAKVFEEEEWVSLEDDEEESTMSPTALRELSFMQTLTALRAPHMASVLDFDFSLGDYQALVIYMPLYRGDVSDAMRENWLDLKQRITVGCDLLRALTFMHGCSPAIAHRDVKPENVLLDGEGRGYLTDFSFACFTTAEYRPPRAKRRQAPPKRRRTLEALAALRRPCCLAAQKSDSDHSDSCSDAEHSGLLGTTTYIAPEVLAMAFPHPSADAWAAGVLLLELFENERLDADSDEAALLLLRKKRKKLDLTLLLTRTIHDLLQEDPLRRLVVAEALAQLRGAGVTAPEAEDAARPAVFAAGGTPVSPEVLALCSQLGAVSPETAWATELYRSEAPDLDVRVLAVVAAKMHEHRPRSDERLVAAADTDVNALEAAQEVLLRRLGGNLLVRRAQM